MTISSKNSSDGTTSSAILSTGIQVAVQALTLFVAYRIGLYLFGLSVLGVWSIAAASATLGRLGDFGFAGAVPRLVASHNSTGTYSQIPALIETAALAVIAGIIILSILMFYPLLVFARGVATPEALPLVFPLLVGANIALVATGIGSAFLGCLDGLGAFRIRAAISILSVIANPLIVYLLGPAFGPISLAIGAIVQATLTVVLGWLALRVRIHGLSLIPYVWSRPAFSALIEIGKFAQANSVLIMLFEPASRMLAGRFGGLEFAAIFDLAAKVSGNLRLLFSSFSQALVPFHAALVRQPQEAQRLFISSTLFTAPVAAITSAIALALAPMFSLFSLTTIDLRFVGTFWLLLLGNLINVVGGPAYAYMLGGGVVAVATQALGLQAGVFLSVAVLLKWLAVDDGVSIAYALAVVVAGLYLLLVACRHLAVDWQTVILRAMATISPAVLALAVLACLALSGKLIAWGSISSTIPLVGIGLVALVIASNLRLIKQSIAEILMFRMKASKHST